MSNKNKTQSADVKIADQGTLWLFWPVSKDAKAWVKENMSISDHMRLGPHFHVEPRFVDNLVQGMTAAGLTVSS